ncbi:hypothetical protein DX887_02545 [Vibrio alginolyticus]|jgi:hypothetical protein|uniref:hypothetical protein n=1 Tax=Vibrio harveyi group TaxID=717610 RepID=UPI001EEE33BA|nr:MULTISPECIES: hypothetical protein [Vibrio harveyi group]EGR2554648.1 hypothetical protein [Vibrio alginolyticus]MCR9525465.1 hypothetical protein [Vibrio alginolyticus]MDF5391056.1 hypothetical protein [Vibrio parahaemolyticus]MDF5396096.1 hypothetical protein [Vibrio parahaemolyticus]ULF88200.1 hypothetical protein K6752_06120 [Vibrio alginolyticus]
MNQMDIKSIFIGILSSLIVVVAVALYKRSRVKSLKDDIELIDFEIEQLGKIRKSSVEMSRSSFKGIFALFFLFGLANLIPIAFDLAGLSNVLHIPQIASLTLWSAFVGVAYRWWKRYENLKNYKEAIAQLESKRLVKESKLKKLNA